MVAIPSFGEGWGRPHVEAMASGTPVIATNWSGPTAYMNPSNSLPIRVQKMQPAEYTFLNNYQLLILLFNAKKANYLSK